jgi:hypothetical protein
MKWSGLQKPPAALSTMNSKVEMVSAGDITHLIRFIRDQRVILDNDLAAVYGVPTKRLNEQYRRNVDRFPEDFAFRLTQDEWAALRSQDTTGFEVAVANRSQNATGSQKHRDPRFPPFAFTEHGALMAANILNSPRAVAMSVYVIRAFVKMREDLAANAAILKRLAEIDKTLLLHDGALRDIYQKLRPLLEPPPPPPKPEIGFHVKEDSVVYCVSRKPART